MKGDNDNMLLFPFTGNVIIQLLNWTDDSRHVEWIAQFNDSIPLDCRQRVTDGERAKYNWGIGGFLPHLDLQQYLHNDMLCLRVSFEDIHFGGNQNKYYIN